MTVFLETKQPFFLRSEEPQPVDQILFGWVAIENSLFPVSKSG